MRAADLEGDEALAKLGPGGLAQPASAGGAAWRVQAAALAASRPTHDRGIGRSWADEILWEAKLSPFKRGTDLG